MPGPVLSSKTGKQYTPQLSDLGKKKKGGVAVKRQASQGFAGNFGGRGGAAASNDNGLNLMV